MKYHFPNRKLDKHLIALLLCVFVIALILTSVSSSQASAANTPTPLYKKRDYSNLLAKAAQGPVLIMVTLNVSYQPEGGLSSPQQQTQRFNIAQTQTRVLAALNGLSYKLLVRYQVFPTLALQADQATLQALAASPDVADIQENVRYQLVDTASDNLIGAPAAWARGYDGTGQVVVIADTGVQASHPFLAGKVIAEACFSTTVISQAFSLCPNGQSTGNDGSPAMTGAGAGANCSLSIDGGCAHGTHVAGIAAGHDYTGGPGYDGVARNARIIAIQVFSAISCSTPPCGIGAFSSDLLAALQYVYTTLRPSYPTIASVNMSLGGGAFSAPCPNDPIAPGVNSLYSVNIASVIATGNRGYVGKISSPACIPNAVSVGAVDDNDQDASFSNDANFMSIRAPGVQVNSSVPIAGGSGYVTWDGTSMATPHVAGAWALFRQCAPNKTVTQILGVVRSTGVLILARGVMVPRIQIDAALASLCPATTTTTASPTATPTSSSTLTATPTSSSTLTATPTSSSTLTATPTSSSTLTATPTSSRTLTATPTSSSTLTATPTSSLTLTATPTSSSTLTATPTLTSTAINTVSPRRIDTIGVYSNSIFYLRNSNTPGPADLTVLFNPYDRPMSALLPVTGDWNGDGVDTIGLYDTVLGVFLLRDSNTPGSAQYTFVMGNPGDEPIAGHWDATITGDGVGVYRPSNGLLYVKRTLATGFADYTMVLGNPGDHGIAGDWDGNGFDSVGVFRPSNTMFYLANALGGTTQLPAIIFSDYAFVFGPAVLTPIAGDWTGSGVTHVGYVLDGTFSLKYTHMGGVPDATFSYGPAGARPVVGHWLATGTSGSVIVGPTISPTIIPAPDATPNGDGQFD